MRVAIIGYGFVGKAIEFGAKKNVEIIKIDPNLGTDISELIDFAPDVCFICVPPPPTEILNGDLVIIIVFYKLNCPFYCLIRGVFVLPPKTSYLF